MPGKTPHNTAMADTGADDAPVTPQELTPAAEEKVTEEETKPTYLWPPHTPWLANDAKPAKTSETSSQWHSLWFAAILILLLVILQQAYRAHVANDAAAHQRARTEFLLTEMRLHNASQVAETIRKQLQSQEQLAAEMHSFEASVQEKLQSQNHSTEMSLTDLRHELTVEKALVNVQASDYDKKLDRISKKLESSLDTLKSESEDLKSEMSSSKTELMVLQAGTRKVLNDEIKKELSSQRGDIAREKGEIELLRSSVSSVASQVKDMPRKIDEKLDIVSSRNMKLSKLLGRQKHREQDAVKALQTQLQSLLAAHENDEDVDDEDKEVPMPKKELPKVSHAAAHPTSFFEESEDY